jgi:hypothetical protein
VRARATTPAERARERRHRRKERVEAIGKRAAAEQEILRARRRVGEGIDVSRDANKDDKLGLSYPVHVRLDTSDTMSTA